MSQSHPFIGTWRLVSWEIEQPDGTLGHPYGRHPIGFLMYTADGYMSAHIMDPDRRQSDPRHPLETAPAQTLSEADRARAYSTCVAYCGTWRVEGETLIHQVLTALIPSWTGSDQVRHFRLEAGRLIIASGGQRLVWERAPGHGAIA
jgi:hypothetical protein